MLKKQNIHNLDYRVVDGKMGNVEIISQNKDVMNTIMSTLSTRKYWKVHLDHE